MAYQLTDTTAGPSRPRQTKEDAQVGASSVSFCGPGLTYSRPRFLIMTPTAG